MARPPEYANWPFDFCWAYFQSVPPGKPDAGPGRVRLFYLDTMAYWDLHVQSMDVMAQKHMSDRDVKPGQSVNMGNGAVEVIPYRALDDEADLLQQRGMQPNPDRTAVTIRFVSGQFMKDTARDWWEGLAAGHLQRRKLEPPVVLNVNGQSVTLTYECFDGLCKDFTRRRGDFVSAGWWPELVDPYRDMGQFGGPKPVQGFANALGHNVSVMSGQQGPVPGPAGQAPMAHPAEENQNLV
jgi:hypothetical protein